MNKDVQVVKTTSLDRVLFTCFGCDRGRDIPQIESEDDIAFALIRARKSAPRHDTEGYHG